MSRQEFIEGYEIGLESYLLFHFSDNIVKWRNQPIPIDVRQFYITQAVSYLPRFESEVHRKLLMSSLAGLGSTRIH